MRVLGIDFGDKHIGLSISDPLQLTAQSFGKYTLRGKKKDGKYFQDFVAQYEISEIVIGLPLRMDGTPGSRVEKTKKFANWLENTVGIPIVFWDERLTTKQALNIIRPQKMKSRSRKKIKDQVSATIILASYLENKRISSNDSEDH
ncbi:MAG: Holliday junction resolvase RuvX [Candidatus Aminicenantes bacterium]|nr:Holliday junction resolvase RuvX [Candidatus Aminicenantes bacterium]